MTDNEISTAEPECSGVGLVQPKDLVFRAPFEFELGGVIPSFTLRYETYGTLNADRSNAILVCHALSGDHHVAGRHEQGERKAGWWDAFTGPGRALDTERYFVIGVNCLGGCRGSTGPGSENPATGAPYYLDFPQLTMRDMVRAQRELARALGITRLHAVIGGSMGGMQGLVWAVDYPDFVRNVVPLACAARQNPQAIAFNEVGRRAIMGDPRWRNGRYPADDPPRNGLAVARMLGHITYLSPQRVEEKFGRTRTQVASPEPFGAEFEVESYLTHKGSTFVERFDANAYLYITKAADRFDLAGGAPLESVFAPVKARVTVIGFSSDWLYPPAENHAVADALLRAGKQDTRYVEIETNAGHDAFLLPSKELVNTIRTAIA
ncbi:MAG: homoserine O-acetyltransferase [Puniceicoccales bacterium]|jgi:homoserine O-acetyltransferase|nr:homoserine O-acetyltransferase [Puniceicoccales bacterium]